MTQRVSHPGVPITVGCATVTIHHPEESGNILVTPDFLSHCINLLAHLISIAFIGTHSLGSKGIHNFVKAVPGLVQPPFLGGLIT